MQNLHDKSIKVAATKEGQAYMIEFAKNTAFLTERLTQISEADRQQISNAFPKLQPFFSGDHAVELFRKLNNL
jgi:hypothetical protein